MIHRPKLFEVRDRLTFIPVLAVNLFPFNEQERYLLARKGYMFCGQIVDDLQVAIVRLGYDREFASSPNYWDENQRTMYQAHKHIQKNWDHLASGDVIDVEFILGETTEPKKSERMA